MEEDEENSFGPDEIGRIVEALLSTTIFGGVIHLPSRGCGCAQCQQHFWEVDDDVNGGVGFEKDKEADFILFPKHHRKVNRLLALKKKLNDLTDDLPIWKKIVKEHDCSTCGDISKEGKKWLIRIAERTLQKVRADDKRDAKKACQAIGTFLDFVKLMTGEIKFKNRLLKAEIADTCKVALSDPSPGIQEEIDEINAALPAELRDATEPLILTVPLAEATAMFRNYIAAKADEAASKQ